ncbi:FAD-binding monooxygenase [Roseibium aestuarii]|uniref:FAD-binding monooxygenase n=1 Tax=Roseibium aestuarii TaxID=2600299 RepID=A0ABW4JW49_9HYPH|nr:FAD-binding monooxygenase [Roseibium aestuarii]
MQFHLDGYQFGDPAIARAAPEIEGGNVTSLPAEVDVMIVGCGPAGLTLAAQLARFPSIVTAIADQRDGPLELGQADGIACRTVEMFQAFGFAEKVLKEAYWVNETTFWKPDPANPASIARSGRIQDTEDGLSEFPHVILNQARVHEFYLDLMRKSPRRLEPAYGRRLISVDVAVEPVSHPVTLTFEHDVNGETRQEIVRARYAVGSDGARSVVRRSIGRELKGDAANQAWGVMDVLAVTDFPDIRMKAAVHSSGEGNLLIIPREGGYLVRLYVEMDKLAEDERVADRKITSDRLVAAAQRILHPYTLDVKEIAWWSVYEIGQRITDRFDNVTDPSAGDRIPSVFIAGDACHTHSPKAGQGMNVSMQDTFNLGWKLAAVLQGLARPELLLTYSAERQGIAQDLIDFDREFARMFSAKPVEDGEAAADAVDPKAFQRYFVKQGRFTAGTATHYRPSVLTSDAAHQPLATGFTVGMRFHSAPVVRLADGKPMELGHAAEADGRWRLYAFAPAGDTGMAGGAIAELMAWLETDAASPVRRFTPAGADADAVFDVRAIFQQGFRDLAFGLMPGLLRPAKGSFGLTDYEKVFCADLKSGIDIFDLRGIDREKGALIVVRPDQYVADVLPLQVRVPLTAYFDRLLLPQG